MPNWSKDPKKRWHVRLPCWRLTAHYLASAPTAVGSLLTYFTRLRRHVGVDASVFTGLRLSHRPARAIRNQGRADRLFVPLCHASVAANGAISTSQPGRSQPFHRLGPSIRQRDSAGTKRQHLVDALGLADNSDLKRRCDRSAEAPFWLVGPKQVGKAAISGWRDLLAPTLAIDASLSIWPFDGRLSDLLARPGIVVAETYPAETYRHLALAISESSRKKGRQPDRAADASKMRAWGTHQWRAPDESTRERDRWRLRPRSDGEDRFDAVVGLFGMLAVVFGNLAPASQRTTRTKIEGWILGHSDA